MNRIIFPLTLEMQGEAVADLQDGLQLLLDRGNFHLSDDDRPALEAGLSCERAGSIYLQATHTLVRLFQEQRQLGASGEVDERTAQALNTILDELGAFEAVMDEHRVVGGQVRNPDGSPLAGALVRAFDKDLRGEERLGEVTTDETGRYEISYTSEQFGRAEKSVPTKD